jgi:hypothetical protein
MLYLRKFVLPQVDTAQLFWTAPVLFFEIRLIHTLVTPGAR